MSLNKSEIDATRSLKDEIAAAAVKAKAEVVQKQGKKTESRNASKQSQKEENGKIAPVDGPNYIECEAFSGKKAGYVFKRGNKGVGYYLDTFYSDLTTDTPKEPSKSDDMKKVSANNVMDVTMKNLTATAVPNFEYRQTPAAISVIVKVQEIYESSVKVDFEDRSVNIAFSSGNEVSEEQKGSGDTTSVLRDYSFSLALRSGAPLAYVFEPTRCTFDVAKENMVVVLMKKAVGIWAEGESAVDKLLQGLSQSVIPRASAPPAPLGASATEIMASVKGMKIADSSAAALYELD